MKKTRIQMNEIIKSSFSKTIDHFGFFAGLLILSVVIGLGVRVLFEMIGFPSILAFLIGQVVSWFFNYLLFKGCLQVTRGQVPRFFEVAVDWNEFFRFLAVSALGGIGILLGALLLLIPGTIFAVWWMYAPLFVLSGKTIGESFEASRELSRGRFWEMFWWLNVLFLVGISGFLLLGLGFFFTGPMALLALVISFDRIKGRNGV